MTPEPGAVVRAAWQAWERRDMAALFALYDPEIVWDASQADLPDHGTYHGHLGVRDFFGRWMEAFDEFFAHALEFAQDGDRVLVRVRQGGTGKGSGIPVEATFWQAYEVRDGLIARVTMNVEHEHS